MDTSDREKKLWELWDWIARQMKIATVPDPVKDEVDDSGYVDDYLNPKTIEISRDDVLDLVRKRMRFHQRMEDWKQGRTPEDNKVDDDSEPPVLELGEIESPRSKALEEYIAKLASCERSVYNFRNWYLEGRVLSPEQARALIASPAAAYLPSYYFNHWKQGRTPEDNKVDDDSEPPVLELGDIKSPHSKAVEEYIAKMAQGAIQVPLVGHAATPPKMEPVEIDKDGPYTPVKVFVDPPGRVLTAKVRGTKELRVPSEDGHPQNVRVSERSVLNELRRVSSRLLRWRPWKEEETSWFVLTGEPPEVPAASGRYRASRTPFITYGTITMTIQPWVSATTVRHFYQRLQGRLKEEKPRASSERNLAVFRFVIEQHRVELPGAAGVDAFERMKPPKLVRPPWRTLLERWNQMYPEGHRWHYKDVRNFSKDFRRAEKAVIHPAYKIPTSA